MERSIGLASGIQELEFIIAGKGLVAADREEQTKQVADNLEAVQIKVHAARTTVDVGIDYTAGR